jgi:hypothetical protein
MKKKIIIISLVVFCLCKVIAQNTQIVDLSTGVTNGTTSLILPDGTNTDDTWKVDVGGGTFFSPKVASLSGTWATDPHANWISPFVTGSGVANPTASQGVFIYRVEFYVPQCVISSATINLTKFGADNMTTALFVNNPPSTPHSISAQYTTLSNTTITNIAGELIPGATNYIYIYTYNFLSGSNNTTYTGLFVYGNLTINYASDPNLIPLITSNRKFCTDAISISGSDGPGTAVNHFWGIAESDQFGNLIPSGYSWGGWTAGSPSNFNHPNPSSIPCNKYYVVKLAVQTPCDNWKEDTQLVKINCLPVTNAGNDITICSGACPTIGVNPGIVKQLTYVWTSNHTGSTVIGTTAQMQVCPTTNTTYTLTTTGTITGCSSSDAVTVTVFNNDPTFGWTVSTSNPNYATITCTPNDLNAPSIPGFGYSWTLQEIDQFGNPMYTFLNDPCWWTFPLISNDNPFNGFDNTINTYVGNSTVTNCNSPVVGHFLYNHHYRITRGTWNDYCTWAEISQDIPVARSLAINSPTGNSYQIKDLPNNFSLYDIKRENDFSLMLDIYPNPSTGKLTVELSAEITGDIEIFNILGSKIHTIKREGNNARYEIDLTGHSAGIYMVNVTINGQRISKKLVLQ